MEMHRARSKHLLIDMYNVERNARFKSKERIEGLFNRIAKEVGFKILDIVVKEFDSGGYSALCLLEESHVSIHTYPEFRFVMVDIFTCGVELEPVDGIKELKNFFRPEQVEVRDIVRGRYL